MDKKEKILISACFLGENCKYNGSNNADKISRENILNLAKFYELIPVCPEQMGGLQTPREPAEICIDGRVRTKTSRADVTKNFNDGAKICLELALQNGCKIALLKQRSPSCGSGEIYDGTFSGRVVSGYGIAAKALKEAGLVIFSENEIDKILKPNLA